jgi:hypothetical protein
MFLDISAIVTAHNAPACLRRMRRDRKQTSARALKQLLAPGDDRP